MTTSTALFSLSDLSPLDRPNATVTPRDGGRTAGCHVKFDNGWTVSIQWGCGNYGGNYVRDMDEEPLDSPTAEIAVWKGENCDMLEWPDGDTVQGWCPMERVQRVLDRCGDDSLAEMYQPPVPEPYLRAHDGWEHESA